MTDELEEYTELIQKLLVTKNFSALLERLTMHSKQNNMFFSHNEHIILPGILKSDAEPEDFQKLLFICFGVGRVRGDYFYTTVAAHFMKETTKTDKLMWIAEPLANVIEEVPRHSNWKLDAVLRVLNRRLDNIRLPLVIDQERLSDGEIKNFESKNSKIFELCEHFIAFYTQLIPALLSEGVQQRERQREERLKVLRCHIIRLLGYPIVNLHHYYAKRKKSKSPISTKTGEIIRKIITLLDLTGSSTDYYLHWLKEDESRLKKKDIDYPKSTNDLRYPGQKIDLKLDVEGVINYFYLIYSERLSPGLTTEGEMNEVRKMLKSQRNWVVSPKYVFETCSNLISNLLSDPVNYFECNWKTLKLLQFLLDELKDEEPLLSHRRLTTENLESKMFQVLLKHVMQVSKESQSREIQKLGKQIMTSFFLAFDSAGSLSLLKKLFRQPENFGVVAHLIENVGNIISDGITHKKTQGQHHIIETFECFSGENLKQLFDSVLDCFDYRQNLIYHHNQIILILDVLRHLLVQDGSSNLSGVMNFFDKIKDKFLKPLTLHLEQLTKHYINNRNFEEASFGSESQKILASLDLVRIAVAGLHTSYESHNNNNKSNKTFRSLSAKLS